jgi:hypothetical protein
LKTGTRDPSNDISYYRDIACAVIQVNANGARPSFAILTIIARPF